MFIIGIAIYVVIVFLLTVLKVESHEEGLRFILLSVLLTPIYTLLVNSKRKKASKINYYYCKECGYIFPVKLKHCPLCEEKGEKIKLIEYESPYNLTSFYQNLPLN